ncbi:hypothetical protein BGZ61DRAFT_484752 [Ilyonectria robusta]|uniref:uncharacterized protein n=1 Tax=Ilyonectria robusta TaxID=1079257 RepID=UPI001E8E903A|nr:uncharacterized protein BGZ61DRAFT_484752 [Ilyonectria robusta]KAH8664927.1 hypothetical protein BGZ61DRAFT_484752 [Ilyonectria robusta]
MPRMGGGRPSNTAFIPSVTSRHDALLSLILVTDRYVNDSRHGQSTLFLCHVARECAQALLERQVDGTATHQKTRRGASYGERKQVSDQATVAALQERLELLASQQHDKLVTELMKANAALENEKNALRNRLQAPAAKMGGLPCSGPYIEFSR